ncbi:FAD-binding domain-containing protein [Trichocladium antarcticum]|uniref:FAD-binding domain-containing protein n=1 Tax=Trichocladium antarcticum TaxID=1450529 RepID=A0AAN6ZBC5_9PEZI|nr:FAD-binding domain-containing protein [Trichocladium antarcticum]
MARLSMLLSALAATSGVTNATFVKNNATDTCKEIDGNISKASDVVFPYQIVSYNEANKHWFASSSNKPACVVKVASAVDVAVVLQIVGASRTPFAVYSGGHASNPGFSSTTGVHITLDRLRDVALSEDQETVKLGFGAAWKDVYKALEPFGRNVVGGRVIGPGVGGFTLGGGYSWKTNQHGLTCDTVKKYHLVLPNGTITTASRQNNQDLFFALKGGLNRFGIVTAAEFYTHPQPPKVWGGLRIYASAAVPRILNATERFAYDNKDARSGLITTLNGDALGTKAMVLFFHDGPQKPQSFDMFDGIPTILDNVGRKSFRGLINSFPSYLVQNVRGAFATVSTSELSGRFLEAVQKEAKELGRRGVRHGATTISYDIEPFVAYGQHATESAFPHADSPLPLNLYFAWLSPAEDEWWHARMRESVQRLKQIAIEEGIYRDSFTSYPNYAIAGTTADELYGAGNAARLRSIRDRIDPDRVMDLAGGFSI